MQTDEPGRPAPEFPTYNWWILLPLPLIITIVLLSYSSTLPHINTMLETNVDDSVFSDIYAQTRASNPHLTDHELTEITKEKFDELKRTNEYAEFKQTHRDAAQQHYRDATGTPYLLDPDAYYYLRYARNILEHGHPGTEYRDDVPFDHLRRGGMRAEWNLLSITEALWHKLITVWSSATLNASAFYLPVLLGAISTILIFFIGMLFFNERIAFFSALYFSVHPVFFLQNMAGFADTPILIMPLSLGFFLSVLYLIKRPRNIIPWILAGLLLLALYHTWNGWYFVLFVFITYFFMLAAYNIYVHKKWRLAIWLLTAGSITTAVLFIIGAIPRVIRKLQIAEIRPGLQSTVIELARPDLFRDIQAFGGILFTALIIAAIILLIIQFLKKRMELSQLFTLCWFITLFIPALLIGRFIFFFIPPMVLLAGLMTERVHKRSTKFVTSLDIGNLKTTAVIMLLVVPGAVCADMMYLKKTLTPVVNDDIISAAEWIQTHTDNITLATWWDTGYVWQYTANRPTILDAGPNIGAIYLSQALMTSKEEYAQNILRMLACSNTKAYERYLREYGLHGITFLDRLLHTEYNESITLLHDSPYANLTTLTHCTPNTLVIIDSHTYDIANTLKDISRWNITLGGIHELTQDKQEAIASIARDMNIDTPHASALYHEARTQRITEGEPAFSQVTLCSAQSGTLLSCSGYKVNLNDLTSMERTPADITLINGNTTYHKYDKGTGSLVIFTHNDEYRSILVKEAYRDSMLVKLYTGQPVNGFNLTYTSQDAQIRIWNMTHQ